MSAKLGEILIRENLITSQQLRQALDYQRSNGGRLGTNLIKLGIISDELITAVLSRQYGLPSVNLELFEIDEDTINLISPKIAMKYNVLPISKVGATITMAMADPTNVFAMDDIKFMTNLNVEPVIASEASIREAIGQYYGSDRELKGLELADVGNKFADLNKSIAQSENAKALIKDDELEDSDLDFALNDFQFEAGEDGEFEVLEENDEIDLAELAKSTEDAPVVRLVNVLMVDALRRGVSDIHFEPYEKDFRVRFRIDGILHDIMHPPRKMRNPLLSRLKIMSKLDISEKRLPQDGRIKVRMKVDNRSKELDFRVSTLPTLFGEKIVLRLLDKDKLEFDMTKLGFESTSLEKFKKSIVKPYGMVLVTGPTGSGKTNTLYSAIQSLNKSETNIMTAEDPIEINLHGVNQVQMKEQIGLNFATALRSFLRQDPNVILVGEIRDFETAEIAIKASLTGHMVLSTLHTNDAPSTVLRLVNMGIEPFLVATSITIIQAQRLVRRICSKCKRKQKVPTQALLDIGFSEEEASEVEVFKGKGCSSCSDTGYKGRVGLFEVMEITSELRDMILIGASTGELRKKAIELGMITLRKSGLCKIHDGITTIEEVLRETVI